VKGKKKETGGTSARKRSKEGGRSTKTQQGKKKRWKRAKTTKTTPKATENTGVRQTVVKKRGKWRTTMVFWTRGNRGYEVPKATQGNNEPAKKSSKKTGKKRSTFQTVREGKKAEDGPQWRRDSHKTETGKSPMNKTNLQGKSTDEQDRISAVTQLGGRKEEKKQGRGRDDG